MGLPQVTDIQGVTRACSRDSRGTALSTPDRNPDASRGRRLRGLSSCVCRDWNAKALRATRSYVSPVGDVHCRPPGGQPRVQFVPRHTSGRRGGRRATRRHAAPARPGATRRPGGHEARLGAHRGGDPEVFNELGGAYARVESCRPWSHRLAPPPPPVRPLPDGRQDSMTGSSANRWRPPIGKELGRWLIDVTVSADVASHLPRNGSRRAGQA